MGQKTTNHLYSQNSNWLLYYYERLQADVILLSICRYFRYHNSTTSDAGIYKCQHSSKRWLLCTMVKFMAKPKAKTTETTKTVSSFVETIEDKQRQIDCLAIIEIMKHS